MLTVPGQWVDDEIFGLVQEVGIGPLGEWLPFLGRTVLPRAALVALVVIGTVAVLRRRWSRVLMGASVVLMSVPTSWLLRQWLPRPDHGYSYVENTLPSTHVTAVTAAVVAIALLIPLRPAWLDRVLLGLVALACLGSVVGYAHRPSDVLASVLLVGVVAGLVGAISVPRRPTSTPTHAPPGSAPR
ncbi:phosphatase PAP2 family protein [Janibacter cremeus]|uniref:Membrane-associated phospholipid phosphatase n=1 Tax=Janibacter cremeus TaxID=1285192 RepID=A0A852VS19_9MICO|nr:phosphatase PAP2 family protein [Janibacter cremeus]NYF99046.1 membrane-associated phospholipid phosphatase [Janibacter cremeus]